MAITTVIEATTDSWLESGTADVNYGSSTILAISTLGISGGKKRTILSFSLSALSSGALISPANLVFKYSGRSGITEGKKVNVYKVTQPSWVEGEVTWNSYSSGNSWSTPGGDYVTSNPSGAEITIPADFDDWEVDVETLLQEAIDNAQDLHLILIIEDEGVSAYYLQSYSKEHTTRDPPTLTVVQVGPPTVTTQTCENVDPDGTTATGRGNITDTGGATVTAHGHCWDTSTDPTTSDSSVDNGAASGTGAYTSAITGLTPGTVYFTRAFATNSEGTSYGANVRFTAALTRAGAIWMEGSNFHGFDENAIERTYIHTDDVDDTPVNGATTDPISSNWAFDHVAAADPHVGYVLESLFDAQTVLHATSDDTPVALTVTEQTLVGRLTGGNIAAVALGIADNNVAQIDDADAADDDYAKFTAAGLEGRSYQELVNDISGVIKATDVEVSELSTATYDDVQDYINFFGDRTLLSGGAITDNGDGTIAIASLTAWVAVSDSETAVGKFFDWAGGNTSSLTDLTTNYIYLDYNAGTPQLVLATDIITHGFKLDHIHIGTAFRDGTETHFHKPTNFELDLGGTVDMHHSEEDLVHRVDGLITTGTGTRNLSLTAGVLYEGLNRHTSLPFDTSRSGTADFNEVNKLHDAGGDFSANDVGKSVHNTTDDTYGTITAFVDSTELTLAGDTFPDGDENYTIDFWTYHYYDGDLGTPAWVEVHGATQIDNAQYNDVDTGLTNFTANRYGVSWVFMEIDGQHFHVVYGQGDYKVNESEEAGVPSSLPNIVTNYCALIAKIILQQGQTAMTITYPWTTIFTSNLSTNHSALANLGSDDHTQYIKDSEFTAADEVIVGTGSGTFGQVTLGASQFLAKKAAGVATNVTAAEAMAILSGAAGAAFSFNGQNLTNLNRLSRTGTGYIEMRGGTAGTDGGILLAGSSSAGKRALFYVYNNSGGIASGIRIFTGDAATTADVERLRITGAADIAIATWANVTHTGIVLSGGLNASGNAITNHPQAITDNAVLTVDGDPNDDEFARFTANGLEGRTGAEVLTDIGALTAEQALAFALSS